MPLSIQIIRNGNSLVLGWADFHVAAMAIASVLELEPSEDKLYQHPVEVRDELAKLGYPAEPLKVTPRMAFDLANYGALANTPLNYGPVTLTKHHKFLNVMNDEVFELEPGDVLKAWR